MTGKHLDVDVCVIGGGSAGLSCAAGAAQLGKKVALIEKGEMGGDCLNYGCVPSKALLSAGAAAQNARDAAKFGVAAAPTVDFAAAMAHVRRTIDAIAPIDSQERFEGLGVTVVRAHARFVGPRTIEAGDQRIEAKFFVVATGSKPFVPPIPGLAELPFDTNETIFNHTVAPKRLMVLGGGPIGVELAQAHRRLGAEVVIVEAASILLRDDPEAVDVVRKRLMAEGVEIFEGAKAASFSRTAAGDLEMTLSDGRALTGDRLLVAVGRRVDASDLDLEAAGVVLENGRPVADATMRTANRRIFVAGDAAGGKQFTHVAGDDAARLVRTILFKIPSKKRDALAPHVTYADPELASVGLSEEAARAAHGDIMVSRWSFEDNDRAQAEGRSDGFMKAIALKNGRILGAVIVGKNAGDQIAIWGAAMANGWKIGAFTSMIAPYPTRSEITKRAAGAFYAPTLFSDRTKSLIRLLSMFD
ncbi:MAG: NAD(P)-binding protein [Alphaproteobacteria bacterium]|nr:NAD(P)-binding protein [Alphaproteobacteria bacterium]